MRSVWWAVAIGGLFVLAASSRASASSSTQDKSSSEDEWWKDSSDLPNYSSALTPIAELANYPVKKANRRYAYDVAKTVELNYGIEGLATYLDAVGFWESRYTPNALGDSGKSVGIYQIRDTSAFDTADNLDYLRGTEEGFMLLNNIETSVLIATDHAVDAIKRSRTSSSSGRPCGDNLAGPGDWLSARRWWKYPSLVHDFCESDSVSSEIRGRFEEALIKTHHPVSFMYERPNVSGWPGLAQAFSDFNISV